MNNERREQLERVFNETSPDGFGIMPFPAPDDVGEGDGSDYHLAQMILYGATSEIGETQIEFAIRLGRALEKAGIADI